MVILLVGFVLINVMYLLFEFIQNIIGKNSKKLSKPYLAFVDLIILILMLAVYMGWSGGYVEKRNQVITVHSITHSTNTNYRI